MIKRPLYVLVLAVGLAVVAGWLGWGAWNSEGAAVRITASFNARPGGMSVSLRRSGELLVADIRNFPSFRTELEHPTVHGRGSGHVRVVLESAGAGIVQNKSEHMNDITVTLPGNTVPSGARVTFVAGDYDEVFAEGVAP